MRLIKGGVSDTKHRTKRNSHSVKRHNLKAITNLPNESEENPELVPYLSTEVFVESLGEGHFNLRFDDDDELLFSA